MNQPRPIARVVNLIPPESQQLWSATEDEARQRLLATDAAAVLEIDGSFALVAQDPQNLNDGERVVLARSLDRPLRYFLAKAADGPVLIVAERIDEIAAELGRRGWAGQFHPTYTRMVPAHHVTTLRLIGCPDPNPTALHRGGVRRATALARGAGSPGAHRRPVLRRHRQRCRAPLSVQAAPQ